MENLKLRSLDRRKSDNAERKYWLIVSLLLLIMGIMGWCQCIRLAEKIRIIEDGMKIGITEAQTVASYYEGGNK